LPVELTLDITALEVEFISFSSLIEILVLKQFAMLKAPPGLSPPVRFGTEPIPDRTGEGISSRWKRSSKTMRHCYPAGARNRARAKSWTSFVNYVERCFRSPPETIETGLADDLADALLPGLGS